MSRVFTYAEIAATEKDESQFLTCIRGKVYDLKEFVSKHPGTHRFVVRMIAAQTISLFVCSLPFLLPVRGSTGSNFFLLTRCRLYALTGGDVIRLGAGRDGSVLFESYHPSSTESKISSYCVGTCDDAPHSAKEDDRFYRTLRLRVEKYLKENGQYRCVGGVRASWVLVWGIISVLHFLNII